MKRTISLFSTAPSFSSPREAMPLQPVCDNASDVYLADTHDLKPRTTFDVACNQPPNENNSFERFRDCILKEQSTSNKTYHLQLKEQDDMIMQLRNKVTQAKLTERSVIASSRHTISSSCISFEPDTEAIGRQLNTLEKSVTAAAPKLRRSSSRTQVLLSNRHIYYNAHNGDASKARSVLLTPQEQLSVAQLPQHLAELVLSTQSSVKKLIETVEQANAQHRKLRTQAANNNQLLQVATLNLQIKQNERNEASEQLLAAERRYQELVVSTQQLIERQRRKFLFERTCGLRKGTHRTSL